jgi:fructuronate reductase
MSPVRLSPTVLGSLHPGIIVPRYERSKISPGIVHLGVGNFHRAHQAVYIDDVLNSGQPDWGIIGVSLQRPDMRDALFRNKGLYAQHGQDGLYSLIEHDRPPPAFGSEPASGPQSFSRVRIIGALLTVLVAPESPAAVIAAMADPRIKWVSLTITEKGYCMGGSGAPDWQHPDIAHDLREPQSPRSALGLIVAALRERQRIGAPPLTVLSCDNLASNGATLHKLLREFSQARAPELLGFIDNELVCPASMVDRIVPHTSDILRGQLREEHGLQDAWPVACERFSQWLIEDHFAGRRPDFERGAQQANACGTVQLVDDVAPFEAMKLRMLNAAHSAIAYLGVPAGWQTVDVAVSEPALLRFIERLWSEEIIPSLPEPVQTQAPIYASSLLERFRNPGLQHLTAQIAMDGSQKVPLRWLPSLRAQLAREGSIEHLALCLAAWINFLGARSEAGETYPIHDPMAMRLQASLQNDSAISQVRSLLSEVSIFGELGESQRLCEAVARALNALRAYGTLAVLRSH